MCFFKTMKFYQYVSIINKFSYWYLSRMGILCSTKLSGTTCVSFCASVVVVLFVFGKKVFFTSYGFILSIYRAQIFIKGNVCVRTIPIIKLMSRIKIQKQSLFLLVIYNYLQHLKNYVMSKIVYKTIHYNKAKKNKDIMRFKKQVD